MVAKLPIVIEKEDGGADPRRAHAPKEWVCCEKRCKGLCVAPRPAPPLPTAAGNPDHLELQGGRRTRRAGITLSWSLAVASAGSPTRAGSTSSWRIPVWRSTWRVQASGQCNWRAESLATSAGIRTFALRNSQRTWRHTQIRRRRGHGALTRTTRRTASRRTSDGHSLVRLRCAFARPCSSPPKLTPPRRLTQS